MISYYGQNKDIIHSTVVRFLESECCKSEESFQESNFTRIAGKFFLLCF